MQIFKWLVYLCVLPCMVSCAESDKERLSRLVKEWEGKEIKFPAHSTFTIQGKDTVNFNFADADYKIISYIDSVGCTSCKLQLHHWKDWIAEVDSFIDKNVSFLFYFHPKDVLDVRYLTRRDNFMYPICFDENDELYKLNKFPMDVTFQTFLLNKENKVMAIGNPVRNPKVKDLYLSLITGKKESKLQGVKTDVFVNKTDIDLGNFSFKEQKEYYFPLINKGKELMVIYDVVTSCGCVEVEYSKQPINSGETSIFKVIYKADNPGYFNKSIRVYCNTENSPIRLTIRGNAE